MKIFSVTFLVLMGAAPCMGLQTASGPAAGPAVATAVPVAVPVQGILGEAEMQRLMPPSVFFRGQTATTQLRNSYGVRFPGGGLLLAGLVDTGGYSTAVREQYQFYLLADTAFETGGKRLGAGAYGCGFLQDGTLLVMDLGGHELLRVPTMQNAGLKRPRPLQMVAGKDASEVRLYLGRDYVVLQAAK